MKGKIVRMMATACVATMLFGMTAFAAPKTMPDGGTFDPEYYAQTYPDVVAAFGTDENLLYQHYLKCGKAEGRLPYAPGATNTSAPASPSVVVTRTFNYVSSDGVNPLVTGVVNRAFKKDKVTVQEMSDGTLFVSHSKIKDLCEVYAPTGEVDDPAVYYQCIGSSSGKVSNTTLLYDLNRLALGTLNYSDTGTYLYTTEYLTEDILK